MIAKSISTANYKDKDLFELPNGERVSLIEYGAANKKAMKRASKIDDSFDKLAEDNKNMATDIVHTAFPEIVQETDNYQPNFIDFIRSIRSDEDGVQYQEPLIRDDGVKRLMFKGPTFMTLVRMFEDNYEAGGTANFADFKNDLINGRYENLFVTPDEYLEPMFDGEPVTRKEGMERIEDAPYEEQDIKGTLLKLIKERTGLGISALFQEEMADRKRGL